MSFVFYSGHGVPDTNSGEPYFVPYNYDPRDVKTTGYSVKEFYKKLESLKARSVTVVVDACYQGFTGDDKPKPIIKDASPVTFEVTNPLLTIKMEWYLLLHQGNSWQAGIVKSSMVFLPTISFRG